MNKITVVVITFNEERNIARCLDSVKDIADEVVVADSFSKDKTKEICLSRGARFIEVEWKGYGAARNSGADVAAYDYILSLDADEELSQQLSHSIAEAKRNGLDGVYEFNRLTNYCGQWIHHSGWYPDKKIRIYPKQTGTWGQEAIHEKLVFTNKIPVTFLKGDLLHYSFYTIEEHRLKAFKYAQLAAHEIVQRGKKVLWLRMLMSPLFRFIKMYFFQLGFLDGYYGFRISLIASNEVFMKYRLAFQLSK